MTVLEADKPEEEKTVIDKCITTPRPFLSTSYKRPYPEKLVARLAKALTKQTKRSLEWLKKKATKKDQEEKTKLAMASVETAEELQYNPDRVVEFLSTLPKEHLMKISEELVKGGKEM